MITYGGPELFVAFIVIVITPLLYWLVLKRFRRRVKIISILALWTVSIFVAYWDVYQISKEARRLCREEAGLYVYKMVEADGFLGASSIDYWSKYGFEYVEKVVGDKKYRNSLTNGEVVREEVNEILSRYEYTRDSKLLKAPFKRGKDIIRDRQTDEILGEIVAYYVYPGWLDSRLIGLLGFAWSPPRCDGDYMPELQKATLQYTDLVKAVIKPKSENKG